MDSGDGFGRVKEKLGKVKQKRKQRWRQHSGEKYNPSNNEIGKKRV